MKTTCRQFRKEIATFRGSRPDDGSGQALKAHLVSCPSCAAFHGTQTKALAALAPLQKDRRALVVPEGLAERIVERIQREAVQRSMTRPTPFFLRATTRRYAPLAASFAVFLAFGLFAGLVATGSLSQADFLGALVPASREITEGPSADTQNGKGHPLPTVPATDMNGQEGTTRAFRLLSSNPTALGFSALKASAELPASYSVLVSSGVMTDAGAFRCYLMSDGSLTLLLLYPSDVIQERADRISEILAPCASPFHIEIIDREDIGSAFDALGLTDAEDFLSGTTGAGTRLLKVDLGR